MWTPVFIRDLAPFSGSGAQVIGVATGTISSIVVNMAGLGPVSLMDLFHLYEIMKELDVKPNLCISRTASGLRRTSASL